MRSSIALSISAVSSQIVSLISFICSASERVAIDNGSRVIEFRSSSKEACEILSQFIVASSSVFPSGFVFVPFLKVLVTMISASSHLSSRRIVAEFSPFFIRDAADTAPLP